MKFSIPPEKKQKNNFKFKTLFFPLFIILFSLILNFPGFAEDKIAVFIVMDSSGSLKQTDPQGVRKIAAKIFINLLESQDLISIVEFDKDARILLPLTIGAEKKKVTDIIEKIGDTGEYTDFQKALKLVSSELGKIKDKNISKMVVLFTDGILEPDLTDPNYRPYNKEFLKEVKQAQNTSERQAIIRKFTELLTPKAERIIYEEILPDIVNKGGEIYAIALTDRSNTNLLRDIVNKTTKHPEENHFFFANSYRDLTKQFIKVLGCRRPIFIAWEKDGIVNGEHKEKVFLDSYIQNINLNLITDHKGITPEISNPSNKKFPYSYEVGGVFYNFSDLPFEAGNWEINLMGKGNYSLLCIAKSKIEIGVKGLKKDYKCKQPIEFMISIMSDGKELSEESFSFLDFSILLKDPKGIEKKYNPLKKKGEFKFAFNPEERGEYKLYIEIKAKDKQNREILPRPSKDLIFHVEKALIINPKDIFFGNHLLGGKKILRKIDIESCLDESTEIIGQISTMGCSNKFFKKDSHNAPKFNFKKIVLNPNVKKEYEIELELPKKLYRGDYKGEITIHSKIMEPQIITFRIHIYTLWEILQFIFPPLIILISGLGAFFIYIWGILGSPSGVLIPLRNPTDTLLSPIKLGQLKRGFLSRCFNWKRNCIRISRIGGDINLAALPSNLKVEVAFYRIGKKIYIRNQSPKNSKQRILVEEPSIGSPYVRAPGQSISLKNKSIITLGEYQFRFEQS